MKYPIIFNFAFFILIFGLSGCSLLEAPEDVSNPMDPNDPDFEPPAVTFIQSPEDGQIVDTCFVRFEWEGNQPSMNYSYRIDDKNWSEWSTDHLIEYQLLDEGNHIFEIKSRYYNSVESDYPQTVSFTVDDIQGPALWIYPRLTEVFVGEQFSVEIIVKDVTDLAIAKIVIEFDDYYLQAQSIQIYDDENAFLLSNGGTIIPFSEYDNTNGAIIIDVGVATGDPASVAGTGAIAKIVFISTHSGNATIQFDTSTELRSPDNRSIIIQEIAPGYVNTE